MLTGGVSARHRLRAAPDTQDSAGSLASRKKIAAGAPPTRNAGAAALSPLNKHNEAGDTSARPGRRPERQLGSVVARLRRCRLRGATLKPESQLQHYKAFRTGLSYREVYHMLWDRRFKWRHTVLGKWREIKLAMWREYIEAEGLSDEMV